MPANDTSVLVGYAPLTKLEKIVLTTEKFLNSAYLKSSYPEIEEGVKIIEQINQPSLISVEIKNLNQKKQGLN